MEFLKLHNVSPSDLDDICTFMELVKYDRLGELFCNFIYHHAPEGLRHQEGNDHWDTVLITRCIEGLEQECRR